MVIISFITFLILILSVGLYTKRFSQQTSGDYLLASRDIPVWQAALSALASTYSGFMYIGLIGYTYTKGISGIWLITFWVIGEFMILHYAPKKISVATQKRGLTSYSGLLSHYWGVEHLAVRKIAATITLIFLSVYAAAQFDAAGKTLQILLDWPINTGVIIAYVIVLMYCFSGGIRASIWTDIVQFILMIFSIAILVYFALESIGGWDLFIDKLHQNPVAYTQFFPDSMGSWFFIILFLFGWLSGGMGIVGQPHVSVRFMAMQNTTKYRSILVYYYSLGSVFTTLCLLCALLAKVYFADVITADFDPETTLPRLGLAILPPVLVGLLLAGIFSAIVSTADSQILSCSAALGHDLLKQKNSEKANFWQNKIATLVVATFALVVALFGGKSVFALVLVAWSGLASSFAPLLLLQFMGYKIPQHISILIMLSGLLAAIIWRSLGLNTITYDGLIGITTGFLVFVIVKTFIPIERNSSTG